MSKKVAVILAGSGVYDGSELHEAVITLLALDRQEAQVQCFAPNIAQLHVVNHLTGEVSEGETRNVLVESARIARGEVKDLVELEAKDFDALIIPGGFGAAKNLCDFALNGSDMTMNETVLLAAKSFKEAAKPVGLMCIAPAMAAAIFGEGVQCTIGTDVETANVLTSMGVEHINAEVNHVVVDEARKLVSTPAYMLAQNISQAADGIEELVDRVLSLA
ncbi:MAG: isoprenoid biosynthesis glyoxalase ElbB [Cellvibrionaceae bacterium]